MSVRAAVARFVGGTDTLRSVLNAIADAIDAAGSGGGGATYPAPDNVFAVANSVDMTKQFVINAAGQAPGTNLAFTLNAAGNRIFRMPNISGMAVVSQDVTGIVLINTDTVLHGSSAGVQYATAATNQGIFQAFQYGVGVVNAPGFKGFKSRGLTVGALASCQASDVLVRLSGSGVAPNLSVTDGGFLSLQVVAGFVPAAQNFLPTELELELTNLAGGRSIVFRVTSEGETRTRRGIRAGGPATPAGDLASGTLWSSGVGSPEGTIVGSPGDIWSDTTAGVVYVKNTGVSTNTGWLVLGSPATRFWHLNGDLSLATTDTGPVPADGGPGTFDGAVYITTATRLLELRGILRQGGLAGTVDAEFLRLRGGLFFSLGIVSLGLGTFVTATAAIPVAPNDVLAVGDMVFVRLRAVQTGNPSDLTLQLTATP